MMQAIEILINLSNTMSGGNLPPLARLFSKIMKQNDMTPNARSMYRKVMYAGLRFVKTTKKTNAPEKEKTENVIIRDTLHCCRSHIILKNNSHSVGSTLDAGIDGTRQGPSSGTVSVLHFGQEMLILERY
mmetsp:Transcript_3957/g.7597  ORF Transcript_3957/g.7597 Transcript_3957/m.7597 type:complete len:130 (+) Transcript_3957:203-592(+)